MFNDQEDGQIDAFELAVVAGLTRRFGPSDAEKETWPRWKRGLCRMTPTKHRWRYSVNADLIRDFETRG
jgi:hypothetical protein